MNRFCFTILVLLIASFASATIRNVPDDYETIAAGIQAADAGDTVLVQPGLYEENLTINGNLVLASLTLTSGDPAYIDSTLIDGGQHASVVTVAGGDDDNVLIQGFTIRNGLSNSGGGLKCFGNSIRLEDLLIVGNRATGGDGGGGIISGCTWLSLRHVSLIENTTSGQGGGIATVNGSSLRMEDCELLRNESDRWDGGALHTDGDVILQNVLVAQNRAGGLGGCGEFLNGQIRMDHVTIADNYAYEYGVFNMFRVEEGSSITNSIIYGNTNENQTQIWLRSAGNIEFTISFTDLEGGEDDIQLDNIELVTEGLFDADPHFIDPENGNYRLNDDSPCIDAGDPDAEPDPDGSRTDMGAFSFSPPFRAFLGGQLLDAATDLPIPLGTIVARSGEQGISLMMTSDTLGFWGRVIESYYLDSVSVFQLNYSAEGYLPGESEVEIVTGDSLMIEIRLNHGELISDLENIAVELDSGGATQTQLTFRNVGNGPVTWYAVAHAVGDAGFEPWMVRQTIPVSEITNDERIEGVIFDGESYYLAGANDNDSNMIYHLSRDGEHLGSFPQPGHSRYGFKDLEWDGELIWGSGEDTVYALNRDGEIAHKWLAPFNSTNNIAYDPHNAILWLSGIVGDIKAYDVEGNYLDREIHNPPMRIYGLSWYSDDPDSSCLYALNLKDQDTTQIHKFNTLTGEMRFVTNIETEGATRFTSASIYRNFDKYHGWVMITIANISPDLGGDQLRVLQVQTNTEWLKIGPANGQLRAGGEAELLVDIIASSEDGEWSFAFGDYEGEIVITHDGFGGEMRIPLLLSVIDPNGVENLANPQLTASTFQLFGAFPNPFNSSTTISFSLSPPAGRGGIQGGVRLAIYDLSGREVSELVNKRMESGQHKVVWEAGEIPAGVYLVRLESQDQSRTQKLILMR